MIPAEHRNFVTGQRNSVSCGVRGLYGIEPTGLAVIQYHHVGVIVCQPILKVSAVICLGYLLALVKDKHLGSIFGIVAVAVELHLREQVIVFQVRIAAKHSDSAFLLVFNLMRRRVVILLVKQIVITLKHPRLVPVVVEV